MHLVQKSTGIVLFVHFLASLCSVSSEDLRAVFDMSDIRGEIVFSEGMNGYTRISPNLTGITSNLTWKIHKYPLVYRGNRMHTCQDLFTGGMFDPTGKSSGNGYKSRCNSTEPSACAIGDLSGKHGHLRFSTGVLLDPDLPLEGLNSIFGRSIVFYNNSSTPLACALIDYDDVITAVTTFRGANSGITGTVRLRQSRGNASSDTSVEIDLFYSNDATTGSFNLKLELADKALPEEGVPSFEGNDCKMTTSRVISSYINVPLASHGPSSERLFFSAKHLPLSGSTSVISKSLILKNGNDSVTCGSVTEILPIEAEALFDVDGVKGSFHFRQDSEFAPTVVTVNVRGLAKKADTYHVHVYRVLDVAIQQHRNSHVTCSNSHVGGHWRPYNTNSASPGNSTVDKYEVGDLSGKYGYVGKKDTISLVRKDYNLPLFGQNSILFRSMVIHYVNGSRWVCSNINPKNPKFEFKVKTDFIGPDFNGTIVVQQASFVKTHAASHITTFFLDLNYMKASEIPSRNHNWHIHSKEVLLDQMSPMGQRCQSTLDHYNPYKVSLNSNYSSTCGPMNLLRCELGDISSKVGKYTIGGGKNRFTESENYFAGVNTILDRSIVVHARDSGAPRMGCASMELISKSFVKKEIIFLNTGVYAKNELSEGLATALKVNKWRVVHLDAVEPYKKKCFKTNFLLIDSTSSDLSKTYEDLRKDWPESLQKFKPVSEYGLDRTCGSSYALHLRATSFVIVVGYLLTHLLG